MVELVGSGYLPPHQAGLVGMSAEVRRAARIDSGAIPLQGQDCPRRLYTVGDDSRLPRNHNMMV